MMASAANELRIFLIGLINTELTAQSDSTPVIAHPEPNRALPYIQVSEYSNSDHEIGQYFEVDVMVYSKTEGPHEIETLQSYIRTALHNKSGVTSNYNISCVRETFNNVFIDIEDENWQGVQRFRALAS